ncbi:MAG TPA: hypothetical protein VF979_03280, partial [Streptosporangiaceae bacterium]
MFDGEVSRAWCAFVEGLVGSQSIVGVAEQVDFDGEGVAVADGRAVDVPYNAEPHKCAKIAWCPLNILPSSTMPYSALGISLRVITFPPAGGRRCCSLEPLQW